MPFITEELWQHIYERKNGESIMKESLKLAAPTADEEKLLADVEVMKQIVAGVRAVRNQKNIAPKEPLALQIVGSNPVPALTDVIVKMANLSAMTEVETRDETAMAFMVGTAEFAVPLGNLIDTEAEIKKMEAEIARLQGFRAGVEKKLSNEKFVANAPEQVVALERKKLADSQTKIDALRQAIEALRK